MATIRWGAVSSRAFHLCLVFSAIISAAALLAGCISVADPTLILVIAAVASLVTPRRFVWVALAAWGAFWTGWAVYEAVIWMLGNGKFGPMCWVYGVGEVVLVIASRLAYSRSGLVPE